MQLLVRGGSQALIDYPTSHKVLLDSLHRANEDYIKSHNSDVRQVIGILTSALATFPTPPIQDFEPYTHNPLSQLLRFETDGWKRYRIAAVFGKLCFIRVS